MEINKEEFAQRLVDDEFSLIQYDCKGTSPGEVYGKVIIKYNTGGSSGGNCWGGQSSSYSKDTDDRKEEAISNLASTIGSLFKYDYYNKDQNEKMNLLCSEFVNENWDSHHLTSYGDYGDYYGNGSDYEVVGYPIENVLKFLQEKNLIEEVDSKEIIVMVDERFKEKELAFNIKDSVIKLKKLNGDFKSFDEDMKKKLKGLEKKKEDLNKQVTNIDKEIKNFTKSKEDSFKSLKSEIKKLEDFLKEKPDAEKMMKKMMR